MKQQGIRVLASSASLAIPITMIGSLSYAKEPTQEFVNPGYLPGAAIIAGLLAALHLLAPTIRRVLDKHEALIGSFGGGMAIGYVFVHLIPELDAGHANLGKYIFLIALGGFVAYYGLETLIHVTQAGKPAQAGSRLEFSLKLAVLWVYNWLIVFALPGQYRASGMGALPIALALCIHLVHKDYLLGRDHAKEFDTWGRYALALAPIAGWVTALASSRDEAINHIFVALLAGSVLYSVFTDELPEQGKSRFPAFVLGVITFLVVALIAGLE